MASGGDAGYVCNVISSGRGQICLTRRISGSLHLACPPTSLLKAQWFGPLARHRFLEFGRRWGGGVGCVCAYGESSFISCSPASTPSEILAWRCLVASCWHLCVVAMWRLVSCLSLASARCVVASRGRGMGGMRGRRLHNTGVVHATLVCLRFWLMCDWVRRPLPCLLGPCGRRWAAAQLRLSDPSTER